VLMLPDSRTCPPQARALNMEIYWVLREDLLGELTLNREVMKWVDRINAREAVKRGLDVPEPFKMKEMMKTKEGEEEYAQYHSSWVMKGQEKDQEMHK